jgi:hypothetical protein
MLETVVIAPAPNRGYPVSLQQYMRYVYLTNLPEPQAIHPA